MTWITEGVCTWVVWSQQLWPGASRETADVRDLQTHQLGGRDTEDLVLKVRAIYFLYRKYVFNNISDNCLKNGAPFSSNLNLN